MAIDLSKLTDTELEVLSSGDRKAWAQVAAEKHGVPSYLIEPIIKQESGGKQEAVSPKGARGIMQLMPGTAKSLGVNPHDWAENIWGGMQYLGEQLDKFGTPELALSAYNAGPGRVKNGQIPNIKETKDYVKNIAGSVDVTKLSDTDLEALASGRAKSEQNFGAALQMMKGQTSATQPESEVDVTKMSDAELEKIAGIAPVEQKQPEQPKPIVKTDERKPSAMGGFLEESRREKIERLGKEKGLPIGGLEVLGGKGSIPDVGMKKGLIDIVTTAARTIDPLSFVMGQGIFPPPDDPIWGAPKDREERAKIAKQAMEQALFPEGVPPERESLPGQVAEEVFRMWPSLIGLITLGGYAAPLAEATGVAATMGKAAIPFALMGMTEEKPHVGAVKGAVLGSALGAMHKVTATIPSMIGRWAARIGGGAGIGGGSAALEGGDQRDIIKNATLFAMFEAFGMPKEGEGLADYAEKKGAAPDLVNELRKTKEVEQQKIIDKFEAMSYPDTAAPGTAEVGKGKRKKIVGTPAEEQFPAEEKLTPAKTEQIVAAAGRERQAEIEKAGVQWSREQGRFLDEGKVVDEVDKAVKEKGIETADKELADWMNQIQFRGSGPFSPEVERQKLQEGYGRVWYSQMQRHLGKALPGQGDSKQLAELVQGWVGKGQFKQDELKWSGLLPWLEGRKGKVTKQEVLDYLEGEGKIEVRDVEKQDALVGKDKERFNDLLFRIKELTPSEMDEYDRLLNKRNKGGDTKFSDYMKLPPGGSNYREVLLGVPVPKGEKLGFSDWLRSKYGDVDLSPGERKIAINQHDTYLRSEEIFGKEDLTGRTDVYKVPSSHQYGDPAADVNRFAHIFLDDRVIGGKKYLTIWEMQSDWAQEGRRKGYGKQGPVDWEKFPDWVREEQGVGIDNFLADEIADLRELYKREYEGVPSFPFSKNWHEVAVKKVLRKAAEEGYDGVAWATGDMVKDRYDLSKHLDELQWFKSESGYSLYGKKGGESVLEYPTEGRISVDKLDEVVGKDVADKIKNSEGESGTLSGIDLKIGGEWANRQYDMMMPEFLKKYGKQWGAAPAEGRIKVRTDASLDVIPTDHGWDVMDNRGQVVKSFWEADFPNAESAMRAARKFASGADAEESIHRLDITPSMKKSVLFEGQRMFSGGPDTADFFRNLFKSKEDKQANLSEAGKIVAGRVSIRESQPDPSGSWLSDLYTSTVSEYHPLKKFMESYGTSSKNTPMSLNFYKMAELFKGWYGKAQAFLEYHPFNISTFEFNKGQKPLAEIIRPIDKIGELDNFSYYLVARRSIERHLKGFETGIDQKAAMQYVRENAGKFEPQAVEFSGYMDNLLQYLRDSEMISPERYSQIKNGSTDYAPLLRLIEPEKTQAGGKGFEGRQVVKKFKGSELPIIDPVEAAVRLTYLTINAAERNRVGNTFIRWAEQSGAIGDTVKEVKATPVDVSTAEVLRNPEARQLLKDNGLTENDVTIFRPLAFKPSENVISVWQNGERKFYRVPKDVAGVIGGMTQESMAAWIRVMSIPARGLRLTATVLTPEFAPRNFFKDQPVAFIHSKYGYVPILDFYRGIATIAKGGENYWKYMISGAPHAEMVSMDRTMLQKKLGDILAGKESMPGFLVRHPIEAMKILSEYSEQGTRIGEFQKGLAKEGVSPEAIQEVGYNTKEVAINFSRKGRGAVTTALNQLNAFWNPSLQGLDRFARAHRENPLGTMSKAAAAITIPAMLLEYAFKDDKTYQNLPEWRKALFFNIPTSIGVVSLPKPWVYGTVYGTIPQKIMRSVLNKDPHAYDSLAEDIGRELPDVPLTTAFGPLLETEFNKKRYTGKPIMADWMKDIPPKFQYGQHTSDVARLIGAAVDKLPVVGGTQAASPMIIDHLIQSYTAGTGKIAVEAADALMRKAGVVKGPSKPAADLADIPIARAFIARYPSADAAPIQQFYKNMKEAGSQNRVLRQELLRSAVKGDAAGMQEAFRELGTGAMLSPKELTQVVNNMHKLIQITNDNPAVTPEQKRVWNTKMYQMMIDFVTPFNKVVDSMKASKQRTK